MWHGCCCLHFWPQDRYVNQAWPLRASRLIAHKNRLTDGHVTQSQFMELNYVSFFFSRSLRKKIIPNFSKVAQSWTQQLTLGETLHEWKWCPNEKSETRKRVKTWIWWHDLSLWIQLCLQHELDFLITHANKFLFLLKPLSWIFVSGSMGVLITTGLCLLCHLPIFLTLAHSSIRISIKICLFRKIEFTYPWFQKVFPNTSSHKLNFSLFSFSTAS